MAKNNNIILVLTLLLLLVSVFGTLSLMNKITFESPRSSPAVERGEIKVEVIPEPGSDSMTGQIALTILPREG